MEWLLDAPQPEAAVDWNQPAGTIQLHLGDGDVDAPGSLQKGIFGDEGKVTERRQGKRVIQPAQPA